MRHYLKYKFNKDVPAKLIKTFRDMNVNKIPLLLICYVRIYQY